MAVKSVTWIAQRVTAEALLQAEDLAAALGMTVLVSSESQVVPQTDSGDIIEYCGPTHPVPEHLFAGGETVFGFEVDDLDVAAHVLQDRGIRLLTELRQAPSVRFCHFHGPGGTVVGLIQRTD